MFLHPMWFQQRFGKTEFLRSSWELATLFELTDKTQGGTKKTDKEGASVNNRFFTTVKGRARATRENDSERSAKPKPSEALNMEGRRGDLKAREENTVRKPQQAEGTRPDH